MGFTNLNRFSKLFKFLKRDEHGENNIEVVFLMFLGIY